MTSCDKRLEELLNRAGQTISDLPESDGKHLTYDRDTRSGAREAAYDFAHQTGYIDVIDCLAMYEDYILHLTDIIDRMEWALDKTLREKAYLRAKYCRLCDSMDGVLLEYTDEGYVIQTCDECDIEHVPDYWGEDI